MSERKIIQIIPALGWVAKFEDEFAENDPIRAAVACWALVEDDKGERYVVGMEAVDYVDFCDATSNFIGYEYDPNAKLG